LKKFTFLIISCLLVFCKPNNEKSTSIAESVHDSVSVFLTRSEDKSLSLSERQKAVNRAYFQTKEHLKDPFYGQVLYQKNILHLTSKEYDSLEHYSNLLVGQSTEIKNDTVLAEQYYLLGYYFAEIEHDFNRAIENYSYSKEYFERIGDSSKMGINLLNIGIIQKNQNDYFGSKETLVDALRFLKDERNIANCYNALATDHRKLLNHSDAIEYYSKAISVTDNNKDRLVYQNNLAATFIDDKQYKKAIALLESAKKDSLALENKKMYPRVLDNIAYAEWRSGLEKRETDFLIPLRLRKRNNDQRGQIASYTHLGEFHSITNPKRAESYFDSVINLSRDLRIPLAEKDALRFLMQLQPENVSLRNRYVFLQDSLYEQELRVKTQFAKYKYDGKLRQESILNLEKENAEKELEANKQRTQKIISLGGLIFLLSILVMVVYSSKQRTKRLTEEKKMETLEAIYQTEAELSRRLHDDHGGKLNQAMLMVQRDTDKSIVLDKLESIYNQIRDFSREINAVDTGPDFWKGLKATLEYTKPSDVEMTFDGGKELDWSLVSHQTKTILFKVLNELVINMARHSRANQTVILFKSQNKELNIYYEDDGVGASIESLLRKNGLQNTEKRIQASGGSITFDSEEGKGFRAEIRIPK